MNLNSQSSFFSLKKYALFRRNLEYLYQSSLHYVFLFDILYSIFLFTFVQRVNVVNDMRVDYYLFFGEILFD